MVSPQLHRVCSGSIRETRRHPSANAFLQNYRKIVNGDTFLLHRIPVAQSDCVAESWISFAKRFKINGHPERRADFVLPAVSSTDRAAFIVKHSHVWAQKGDDLLRLRNERLF